MSDFFNSFQIDQLLKTIPGGIAKIAYDDILTIVYATDEFYCLIQNATDPVKANKSMALLRMVYSADIIYVTQQIAAQKNRTDKMFSLNFRTLKPDGGFKWVMITGNLTSEVYQSGDKVVPVYSCIAMDISDHMLKYKQLEQTYNNQRTISELSRELVFEYDIASDTLEFTELFREIFGKESKMSNLRSRLEKTKLIHPDELVAVNKIFTSMMAGKKQVRFELRLIGKDGMPCWYICYASIIFDENRNPSKICGKLSVMNMKKEKETAIKPQLDSLTKLCTKEATENLIMYAIGKQEAQSLSAMLLIEVRNNGAGNERMMAALGGDNVLVTIAGMLKARFRTTDIIGRIGMNEFLVYIKDLTSERIVLDYAEQLCKEVENIYGFQYTRNRISIDIGIAFQKGKHQEFQALLANAHTALTLAKKEVISSFEIFQDGI
jgi:diguanylate cyclase (GGDEF)-like protein